MRRLFFSLSALFSAGYLALLLAPNHFLTVAVRNHTMDGGVLLKVGAIFFLMLTAACGRIQSLATALFFSCIGDFLLGVKRTASLTSNDLFVFGLFAFLCAHLCYIRLFCSNRSHEPLSTPRKIGIALVILALGATLQYLWPSLGTMRLAVLIYALALDTMAITAISSRFPVIVVIGASFFVVSDSLLALGHFVHAFLYIAPVVWITYYWAQLLITLGVVSGFTNKSFSQTSELR